MKTKTLLAVVAGITLSMSAVGQTNSSTTMTVEPMAHTPTFRVDRRQPERTGSELPHRSGPTQARFRRHGLDALRERGSQGE